MELFKDPNFYKLLITSALILMALAYLFYMLNDLDLMNKRRKYETSIKNAINLGKIRNEDIYLLAERWHVKKEKISINLYFILNDYLNEKNCSDEKLNRIREIIFWHQEQDPFSDLPDNIKFQLQHLQNAEENRHVQILHLSKSLGEIYVSNQRKTKRDRIISLVSCLAGIIGVLYGFLS